MHFDITKVDPNFLKGSAFNDGDFDWYNAQSEPFEIRGLAVAEGEIYARLPVEDAEKHNEGVQQLMWHTAGGHVRFETDAEKIALRACSRNSGMMSHMTLAGSAGLDIYRDGVFCSCIRPMNDDGGWFEGVYTGKAGMSAYEVNMPLYNGLTCLLIGVSKGAKIAAPKPYTIDVPVVYYGSSITQGGCASRPGNSYQGHLSRWLDADQINLGFSGSARGEKEMAEYIASLHMSAFVMDYDHNAPNEEHLRNTHKAFFEIIRAAHPDLPVIFVSKPDFESNPAGSEIRRKVILDTYHAALQAGDKKVWFVDGETLFGTEERDACTVDTCHPNDLGFYRMAKTIYPVLKEALETR